MLIVACKVNAEHEAMHVVRSIELYFETTDEARVEEGRRSLVEDPIPILSLRHHLLATPISASFIILLIPLRIHLSVIQIERHKGSKAASRCAVNL